VKAAIQTAYGPPEVVVLREIERPVPTGDEVLVRVHAASVNRADLDGLKPRPSFLRVFMGVRRPRNTSVGIDVAGVVEAVGPDVTRFKPGDRVFGDLFGNDGGTFAEFVAAPQSKLQGMPDDLSFEDASTLPHSAILAIQGLRLRNGRTPQPGGKVLINGASGNVGPFAVQIAKSMGAEVTGACRTSKVEFVRSLGADHVIDYTQVDFSTTGERYDWIVDTDSHQSIRKSRRALKPKGVYVTLGGETRPLVEALVVGSVASLGSDRYSGLMLWWKLFHPPDVEHLKDLMAAGKVRPVIDRRYPLSEVVDALRYVEDGKNRGKVVVTMEEPGTAG
jgi:NADPH:quinone reductase-like Zn-dependent oxidoreductase